MAPSNEQWTACTPPGHSCDFHPAPAHAHAVIHDHAHGMMCTCRYAPDAHGSRLLYIVRLYEDLLIAKDEKLARETSLFQVVCLPWSDMTRPWLSS